MIKYLSNFYQKIYILAIRDLVMSAIETRHLYRFFVSKNLKDKYTMLRIFDPNKKNVGKQLENCEFYELIEW